MEGFRRVEFHRYRILSRCRSVRVGLASLLLSSVPIQAQAVKDPKASLTDIAARQQLLMKTADPVLLNAVRKAPSCLATTVVDAPGRPIQIPHHYMSGSNGPTNPEEAKATANYGRFEQRVTAGAAQWLAKGNEDEANCALQQLLLWEKGGALSDYDPRAWSQSWYQVEWTLASTGVAMTVLVNDSKLDKASVASVVSWLDKDARRLVSFERPGKDDNNHHYWRALAATSIGIVSGDKSLFDFGISAYKGAIGEIDGQGAFPKEMARHENAIHYQAFALDPLSLIAQLGGRQGIDLFSYSSHGHTLKDAIVFLGKATENPALVARYASEPQKTGFHPADLNGLLYAVQAYGKDGIPDSVLTMTSQPAFNTRTGGDALLFIGPQR